MKKFVIFLTSAVSVLLMGGGIGLSLLNNPAWGWLFATGAIFLLLVCCMVGAKDE